MPDKLSMDGTGATSIAKLAMEMKSADLGNALSAAVTRQILAQEKRQGQAIVKTMKQSEEIIKNGRVDVYA